MTTMNEQQAAQLIANQDASPTLVLENSSILAKRAILVYPNLCAWGGKKIDREETHEYNERHGITQSKHESKIVKQLLPDLVKACKKPIDAMRNRHYELTLPYSQRGEALLPTAMYFDYMQEMSEYREQFEQTLNKHLALYDEYMAQERREKNGAFNPALYPTRDEIRAQYKVNFSFRPVPDAGNWIVDIEREELDKLRVSVAANESAELENAMRECWSRLHKAVNHMAQSLGEYGTPIKGSDRTKTFRNSLVDNVQELCEILPKLNITGDATLHEMTQAVRDKLTAYDPDTLRNDPSARNETLNAAQDILDSMAAFTGQDVSL